MKLVAITIIAFALTVPLSAQWLTHAWHSAHRGW